MKRAVLAASAAAAVLLTSIAAPGQAQAQNGAVAAGVLGGLAAGAIIGGAIASPYGYGPGPYYYGPGPAYYGGYGGDCYWQRQRVWDGYGWVIRRVRVCY